VIPPWNGATAGPGTDRRVLWANHGDLPQRLDRPTIEREAVEHPEFGAGRR
jgi:hypothetical protein